MLKFIQNGDLFQSKCDCWINPVNCVGVAGKGLALEFKNRFPDNYYLYQKACRERCIKPGQVLFLNNRDTQHPKYIISFPTKKHWKNPSQLEWIRDGLTDLRAILYNLQIKSVAIPGLGAGNGRLNWLDVKSIIIEKLSELDCYIEVYEPK